MRKLTKEEFINREPDLLNGEYEFVGEYKGANTKTLFKHNQCGYKWEITPSHFQKGTRCPRCAGFERFTKESFCEREEDIKSGEYEMLGKYSNGKTGTLFRHNVCGYEWVCQPKNFHAGRRCPECGGTQKLTKREFCEREDDIQSGQYKILGDYVNTITKVLFKHLTCGYEWNVTPDSFHRGSRCPKCAAVIRGKKLRLTKEEFIEREKDIQSGEYQILGKYINIKTKTLFKHTSCGYEWNVKPDSFHQKHRCPRCQGVERLTKEGFCEREDDIKSGEYLILGEYININTKTLFKHNQCGYKWEITPSHFYSGERCPKCNQSKGEKSITNILGVLNIPFESQKIFNTCRHKRPLPFDFYVNNSFLIEYDGEQHFKPVNHFGGNKEFNLRQIRDNIKTQWAKDNGIPLVRIPYTEFDNIEQIIKDNIEKYSIQKAG